MTKFWTKVNKTETCWLWTKAVCKSRGYGRITIDKISKSAHRVSWELTYGPIPHGMSVLHKCDNRICVNPDHLFLGTQKDNMIDMVSKGRSSRGSKNAFAKLTEDKVLNILQDKTSLPEILAAKYNVSRRLIALIKQRKAWKHVIWQN